MDEKETHVRAYLYTHHYGRANAAPRHRILEGLKEAWPHGTLALEDREFRAILAQLRHKNVPVGGTSRDGVYVAASREELQPIIADYRAKAADLVVEANILDRISFEQEPVLPGMRGK